ncbi:UNVERIFIED_CONTAM: hypothetical protein PYX00_011930 [Menopon gallinae]|uniref:Peptidase M16 C-terminal domain-containing protein n=1 Tax=Menopon gallinae TaxID=328185 RepID=A0AAW2H911_9NEOP
MILETGYLKYRGQVARHQNNFGGLGALDSGEKGASFASLEEGVRAHIQHLKAYACNQPLSQELVDPRFYLVKRGSGDALGALEKNILGAQAGDELSFVIKAQEAYGEYDFELLRILPRSSIKAKEPLKIGQQLSDEQGKVLKAGLTYWGPSEEDKQNTKLTLKRLTENLSELEKPYAKESFASFSDKEIKTANLLIYKREDTQEQVLNALSEKQLTKQVLFWLFDRRIKEFLDQTSPLPFQGALMGEDLMAGYLYRKPILANVFRLDLYQGREKEGLRAFFQEYERLLRFGFTQEEWKLCQQSLLEDAKIAYENKDKRSSQSLAQELSALSLEESSLFPSMEEAFKALKVFLAKTRLKTINEALTQVLRGEDCLYFYSYNPEANSCLSKQDVLALREELKKTNLVPYVFKKSSQLTGKSFREPSLLPKSELLSDSSAFSSWILDNGIRIYFKRNTQIPKTVSMRALARGLVDLDTPQQWKEMYLGAELVNQSGWGELSRSQTKQFLLDKNLSLITTYSLQAREISGHFDWDSKEDFFQCLWSLVRLAKIDKSTLEEFKQNLKEELSKEQWDYKAPFRQAIRKALYANNPFSFDLAQIESTLAHLNLDRVLSFYKKQFDDLSNFSFIFVGDIEENEIIRLSAKYLGALEIKKENLSKSIKDYLPYSKGTYKRILNLDPEERATAFLSFTYNDLPLLNDLKEEELRLLIQALELAYSRLLLEEVREGLSGVYSINFLIINRLLENLASRGQVQVSYVSSPQKLDQVNKAVKKVLEKGQASAFNDETLDYVRKYLVKTYTKAYEENSYWLNYAIIQCLTKGDWKHSNIEDLIGIVEAKHLEELAKILIDWKALKEIYLLPKGKE